MIPACVLEGEPNSGTNVGYDTIYVAGSTGGVLSFGTTVLTRGAVTDDTTLIVETDKGTNDDPNADLIFAVGDVIHTGTDDVLGTIGSIGAFDTNNQPITFTAPITDDLGDNEELFMATKGTNAKIKELKGIKPERITDEQLKKVQDTVNTINRSQLEIGSMEIKKHEMMHRVAAERDSLITIQEEFEKEYGTFDVNINDGLINYPADVEANKED